MRRVLIPALFVLGSVVVGTPATAFDLNPLSAIKSAVEAAAEDRSATDIAKDTSIKASIAASVIDEMGSDVISISADVYEQDVMLTGIVEAAEQKEQAGKLTKAVEHVKKVYNEVMVVKDVDRKKGTAEGFIDDSVIESKINALLLDASGVNVTNFRWRSVEGNVFLFGRSLSSEELKKAVAVVKDIKNVIDVTNRVKIKPKED
ncbi:MAG: BON domain-containing protein [Rhodospirillales bacterium]|jgi:hyperosmotically inducible periplasmic protein|nr:BON domain-containing protein [Rhodospirillales bacterium]